MSRPTNAIREVFCSWNPEFWALDSGIKLLESGTHPQGSGIQQRVKSVIQVQLTRNPESSIWSPESTAWNPGSKTFLDYLIWGEMKKHSSWDAYSAAHAPDRVDFKSIHSFVRNHSLLKEGNVLVKPSNSTLNMLFSCRSSVSYFDYRSRRPQINMGNSI